MMSEIHLICLTQETTPCPHWSLGQVFMLAPTPQAIANWLTESPPDDRCDEWWLFWDMSLGHPNQAMLEKLSQMTSDVYHAGLRLGLSGWPQLHNFVNPTWPLNRDPAPTIEATAWRLSLRACLVRGAVLSQLGGPDSHFNTLSGASLELGHRWIRKGAFVRHIPSLVETLEPSLETYPVLEDEFGFIYRCYGRMWTVWAFFRAIANYYPWWDTWLALREIWHWPMINKTNPIKRPSLKVDDTIIFPTVSVLIPTLDRYPHLFSLLNQLRQQTVFPQEIIVVDQTETANRQVEWPKQFVDLPLKVVWQDETGQCSSRNAGLQLAQGECILLFDDDIEIPKDLIARHLKFMAHYQIDASCGTVEEVGNRRANPEMSYVQTSSVFPAGNSLVRRDALYASGLFDLAYNKGSRADGDLGMRLYLAGKQLLLNPIAQVIHLHAPRGGLRQYKARTVTRASSRSQLWQRHLLSPTEGYLWSRYFSTLQQREALWIRTFATLRHDSNRWRKWVRFIIMALLLPLTYYQNWQRLKDGLQLNETHPSIPPLMRNEGIIGE